MRVLTFDIEIKNCIQGKDEPREPSYNYCDGWDDKGGMGIAVLCAYASWSGEYHYFDENNLNDFKALIEEAELVSGFNIFGFDVPLLKATLERLGHDVSTGMAGKCYDLFGDVRKTIGGGFPKGWNLSSICRGTFKTDKTEEGANAPRLWQKGEIARLYNYVTQDVKLEHQLFEHALQGKEITSAETGESITLLGISKYAGL